MRVVVATRNRHKLAEISALLADTGHEFIPIDEIAPSAQLLEDEETFEANAIAKARQARDATGLPAIGDDSGLVVNALSGAPGIRSARYAGEPCDDRLNNEKLLHEMRGIPAEQRGARFICAAAFVPAPPSDREIVALGRCLGTILEAPRGAGGFGYDPLFWIPDMGMTMAELSPEKKNSMSHRRRAFWALATACQWLPQKMLDG